MKGASLMIKDKDKEQYILKQEDGWEILKMISQMAMAYLQIIMVNKQEVVGEIVFYKYDKNKRQIKVILQSFCLHEMNI